MLVSGALEALGSLSPGLRGVVMRLNTGRLRGWSRRPGSRLHGLAALPGCQGQTPALFSVQLYLLRAWEACSHFHIAQAWHPCFVLRRTQIHPNIRLSSRDGGEAS